MACQLQAKPEGTAWRLPICTTAPLAVLARQAWASGLFGGPEPTVRRVAWNLAANGVLVWDNHAQSRLWLLDDPEGEHRKQGPGYWIARSQASAVQGGAYPEWEPSFRVTPRGLGLVRDPRTTLAPKPKPLPDWV